MSKIAKSVEGLWKPGKIGGMKNRFRICGEFSIIYVKKNSAFLETYVNTDDLYRLFILGKTWCFGKGTDESFYVTAQFGNRHVSLHRLLMNAPEDKLVDHINGKPQDNRMCNLRLANHSENGQNLTKLRYDNSSGFRGVFFDEKSNSWNVQAKINNKVMNFGKYETKELASYVAAMVRKNFMPYSIESRMSEDELEFMKIAR